MRYVKFACRFLSASLVLGLVWSAPYNTAMAQVPSDQIIDALVPPVTRGLTAPQEPPLSGADRAFIDSLHHRTRSLTLDEGEHAVALGKDRQVVRLSSGASPTSRRSHDKLRCSAVSPQTPCRRG